MAIDRAKKCPYSSGQRVTIPAGTVVWQFDSSFTLPHDQTVTVYEVVNGYVTRVAVNRVEVTPPRVCWWERGLLYDAAVAA